MIIAKTVITSIIESQTKDDPVQKQRSSHTDYQNSNSAQTRKSSAPFDPYLTLRVSKEASVETVRVAYKDRLKSVHPDMLAALDLDPDLKRAAILSTQKVNRAYQTLMKRFKERAQDKDSAA